MAGAEDDIIRDEQERSNLLRAIAEVETAILTSTPSVRRTLENALENAKKRIVVLDKRIEDAKVEHAAEVQAHIAAAAAMAAKETKLNAEEQETYRGFLEKAYFTKKDFGKLDEFYKHSYDRLSEGGRDEMSKRIHEGVRRGEFKFTDLPERVQEKDKEHRSAKAKQQASAQSSTVHSKSNIERPVRPTGTSSVREIDLSSVQLNTVKLMDADARPSVSSVPNLLASNLVERG